MVKKIKPFILLSLLFVLLSAFVTLTRSNINWDGKKTISIAFVGESLWIGNLSTEKERLVLMRMPNELVVETAGDLGTYPLSSIFSLYETSKKSTYWGMKKTIINNLGISVDGYFYLKSKSNLESELKSIFAKKNKFGYLSYLFSYFGDQSEIKTNLSFYDYYRFVQNLSRLRDDEIVSKILGENDGVAKTKLPDGSLGYIIDDEIFDTVISKYFTESDLVNEGLRISVYNATGKTGMANNVARTISNLGGKVVNIANKTNQYNSEIIIEDQIANSETVKKIEGVFNFKEKRVKEQKDYSDIEIILGKDWIREI